MSDIIAEYDAMLCMRPPMRRGAGAANNNKDLRSKEASKDVSAKPEVTPNPQCIDEEAKKTSSDSNDDVDASETSSSTTTTSAEVPSRNGDS